MIQMIGIAKNINSRFFYAGWRNMRLKICKLLKKDISTLLVLLAAAYFLYVFHCQVGLPPQKEMTPTAATYLFISIGFFLLPFAKKLKIASLIEYEANIEELKKDVQEFKGETRQIMSTYSGLISAVTNTISQSITVNVPGIYELQKAKDELDKKISKPEEELTVEEKVSEFLAYQGQDLNYALAKLRMEIEKELRRILGKRQESSDPTRLKGKFLSATSLFRELSAKDSKFRSMLKPFDYVLRVCNAGIHGQIISEGIAHEAMYMGFRILEELRSTLPVKDAENEGVDANEFENGL